MALTESQKQALTEVYDQDVTGWDWYTWFNWVGQFGCCKMWTVWRMLPYKPVTVMRGLRREMNDLYLDALNRYAAEYGCKVLFDEGICADRLLLYNPEQLKREELKEFINSRYDGLVAKYQVRNKASSDE